MDNNKKIDAYRKLPLQVWLDETPPWKAFFFHLAMSTFVALVLASVASLVLERVVGIGAAAAQFLTLGPTFIIPIGSGICLGYAFGAAYWNKAVPYVWVVALILSFATFAIGEVRFWPRYSWLEIVLTLFGPATG